MTPILIGLLSCSSPELFRSCSTSHDRCLVERASAVFRTEQLEETAVLSKPFGSLADTGSQRYSDLCAIESSNVQVVASPHLMAAAIDLIPPVPA